MSVKRISLSLLIFAFSFYLTSQVTEKIPAQSQLAQVGGSGKALFTQNDFKYIGSFVVPFDPYQRGLAIRTVNGQTHGFTIVWAPSKKIYEYNIPAPSLNPPYPNATMVKDWGAAGGGKATLDLGNEASQLAFRNLFWDSVDQRLYWSYVDQYNAGFGGQNNPTVGYSTIDAAGVVTSFGSWRFTGMLGPGWTGQCVTSIPSWFAQSYLNGKRLAAGCGSPESGAVDYNSQGPTLTAFDPPVLPTNPELSSLNYKTILGYPYTGEGYANPHPPFRSNTDYFSDFGGWNPLNGQGYWSRNDAGTAVWIDTPTKSGLFYFTALRKGRFWYYNATTYAQLSTNWWWEYDPADLAAVAQGSKLISDPQPATTWQVNYPNVGWVTEGEGSPGNVGGNGSWTPDGSYFSVGPNVKTVTGAFFDPITNLLYIQVKVAGPSFTSLVNVYQVGDNIAPASPAPPATPPTVVLNITPKSLPDIPTGNGNSSIDTAYVTWYADNATSVTLSPGVGAVSHSGTLLLKQTVTTTYTLTATNSYGSTVKQATVTMGASAPAPTITISASPTTITSGSSSTLTWSSTDTTSCTASGSWSGSKATSGSQSVSPTISSTYTLSCTGSGGSTSNSASITVTTGTQVPTVNFSASPTTITSGSSSTLTWSSTSATSCTASGAWTGSKATSGTQSVSPTSNSTYTLDCTGTGGSATQSTTITISTPGQPSPDCTKAITVIDALGHTWTIAYNWTLRDGAYSLPANGNLGGAQGSTYKIVSGIVHVLDPRDSTWYKWNEAGASFTKLTTTEPACGVATILTGDLNGDKIVNSLDWSFMNSKWFTTDSTADLNHDGLVNAIDFSLLNANWFKTIP